MIESLAFTEYPVEGNPRARTIHDYDHAPRIARVCQDAWALLAPGGNTTSFGEDAQGELYLMTSQGGFFRIVPN